MQIHPRLRPNQHLIKAVESHTMGEPTRVIYDGFPELPGDTMMEKKIFLTEHYDYLRSALMLEPRGHRDMFGALVMEPTRKEADFGVIFMDTGGYLNMCGHGSMGVATVVVEMGLKEATEPYTEVVLDTPAGLVRTMVHVAQGQVKEVSIVNVPSFLYLHQQQIDLPRWGKIEFDISFGGSFFALVDADRIGLKLDAGNVGAIETLGMEILGEINRTIPVKHPHLDVHSVDLVEFYSKNAGAGADMRNCVVFGDGQIDRSPCGTGTSAKLAALCAKGELKQGEEFVYESITGSRFRGTAVGETEVAGYKAIVPRITGSAYVTGINQWILNEEDPCVNGFLLRSHKPCV